MLTRRFDQLFSRLVTAFERHQGVPRSPQNVVAIASARRDLDLARNAMAVERQGIINGGVRRDAPHRTAVSDDDLARLRVLGAGFVGG